METHGLVYGVLGGFIVALVRDFCASFSKRLQPSTVFYWWNWTKVGLVGGLIGWGLSLCVRARCAAVP